MLTLAVQTESQVAERTSLKIRWDEDGTATIRCRVPTEDAAILAAAIEERDDTA
ncbi:MAG: hypothetical protein WKF86_01065 [Acidimicrobiales bacterium]